MKTRWISTLLVALAVSACTGIIGDGGDDGAGSGPGANGDGSINPNVLGVGKMGLRRLTRVEYGNTVRDLLGQALGDAVQALPEDKGVPFDNDYRSQAASQPLIDAVEMLAEQIATNVLADPARKTALVGCTPTKPDDADCMRKFVVSFGRRALRRPLTEDEIGAFLSLQSYAVEDGDFYVGVGVALRAFLQHHEFMYRIELGTAVPDRPGLFRLNDWEIATRLSYFLWGTMPSDALLDKAQDKRLSKPDDIRAAAVEMMSDPRSRARIEDFHEAWLGLSEITTDDPALTRSMHAETTALIDRVIFERHEPWTQLFTADQTFIDDKLARHYGLPPTGSDQPTWVSYGPTNRRGLLSHATFLANGAKFNDTSPTRRGKMIRNRLLCQEIPPPPPETKVDDPPAGGTSTCKKDRYQAHAANGLCKGCHSQMDPIGFGIEQFDAQGRFRATDKDAPDCPISGDGELVGVGTFNGPAGLGDLLVKSGRIEPCLVKELYRFAWGRADEPEDSAYLDALTKSFQAEHRFDTLVLGLVTAEAFAYRREE